MLLMLAYILFIESPRLCALVAKAHATQDGHRDPQATLAKLAVLAFGVGNGLAQTGRDVGRHL